MKLNTRVLLLVAPVVLMSAALSSYSIYENQKSALIKRENSYLQLTMEKLASHFRHSRALINSYSLTLTKSDLIRHYFTQDSNPYREKQLVDNLHKTIATLQSDDANRVSIALLDRVNQQQFYADNQPDAFEQLDQSVQSYVLQTYQNTGTTSHIGFTQNFQGESILVRYDVLDKQTFETPTAASSEPQFFVIVSLSLDKFNQLRHILELDNDSSIFFSSEPVVRSGLTQTIELQKGLYATLDPAPYLLTGKLKNLEGQLTLSYTASSTITLALLLFLLYRHVIKPITQLDKQLQEVEQNKRTNIQRLPGKDEIARLSSRFFDMYRELNASYQKTKAMAELDHLTQLANRYQFQQYVEQSLQEVPEQKKAWILYIDLDNFKYVNDKYGHHLGDSLLVSFASHVRSLCLYYEQHHGVHCLASRLSGDEFAVYITFEHYQCLVEDLAKQILEPIQNGYDTPMGTMPITASIGIATYPEDGPDVTKLLSHADTAMYQAKRQVKIKLPITLVNWTRV